MAHFILKATRKRDGRETYAAFRDGLVWRRGATIAGSKRDSNGLIRIEDAARMTASEATQYLIEATEVSRQENSWLSDVCIILAPDAPVSVEA